MMESLAAMEVLKTWWEVPTIAHFCHTFGKPFHLFPFEIEELESLLVGEGEYFPHCPSVEKLIEQLLKGLVSSTYFQHKPWQEILCNKIEKAEYKYINAKKLLPYLKEPFSSLSMRAKVEILLLLCEMRVQVDAAMDATKDIDVECLRLKPIGIDSRGNIYWYFFGLRLYKEHPVEHKLYLKKQVKPQEKKVKVKRPAPVENKGTRSSKRLKYTEEKKDSVEDDQNEGTGWIAECDCLQDWSDLSVKLSKSSSDKDQALSNIIQKKYLPILVNVTEERDALYKKRIRQQRKTSLLSRHSSRIETLRQRRAEAIQEVEEIFPQKEVKKVLSRAERMALRNSAKEKRMEDEFEDDFQTDSESSQMANNNDGKGLFLAVENGQQGRYSDSEDDDEFMHYESSRSTPSRSSDEESDADSESADQNSCDSDNFSNADNSSSSNPCSKDSYKLEPTALVDTNKSLHQRTFFYTSHKLEAERKLKAQQQDNDLLQIKQQLTSRAFQGKQEDEFVIEPTYSGASNYTQILNQAYTNGLFAITKPEKQSDIDKSTPKLQHSTLIRYNGTQL